MTKRKLPPEAIEPTPVSVTPAEVRSWFEAASVVDIGNSAAKVFATIVEKYRAYNCRPPDRSRSEGRRIREAATSALRKEAEKLKCKLVALWTGPESQRPARSPEMIALTIAVLTFCEIQPDELLRRIPHRPTQERTSQTQALHALLVQLLPDDTPKTAIRSILRSAIIRCGFKVLPSAEIGKMIARQRRGRGPMIAALLLGLAPSLKKVGRT